MICAMGKPVTKQEMLPHLEVVWPKLAPLLSPAEADRREKCLRQREPDFNDQDFFKVLLTAAWEGTALRGGHGQGPKGGGLYKRLRLWRDTDNTLQRAVMRYAKVLTPTLRATWLKRLEAHDAAVRANAKSHPAGWMMVNRYWYDAVVEPLQSV